MLVVAALLGLPLLQIGASYYLSGATLVFALTMLAWRRELAASLLWHCPVVLVLCAGTMLSAITFAGDDAQPLLRAFREAFFLYVIVCALEAKTRPLTGRSLRTVELTVAALALGFAALVVVQTISLGRGQYFGLPREFFVANADTLPGRLNLIFSRIRPTGTFGEPSYLGFVLLSLVVCILPAAGRSRPTTLALAVMLAVSALIASASFIFAVALVLCAYAIWSGRLRPMHALAAGLAVAVVAVAFDPFSSALGRLFASGNRLSEESGYARLVAPAAGLVGFLPDYPLGLPLDRLRAVAPYYTGFTYEETSHNAFYNFFYAFGLYGAVVVFLLMRAGRDAVERAYILASTTINGGFLSVDKSAVVVLAILMFRSSLSAASAAGSVVPAPVAARR